MWKDGREPIFGYKEDGKFHQVRFIQKPFDLTRRLFETGHVYESKAQKDSD